MQIRRILVPLNGTQTTAAALGATIRLAVDRDVALVLLHVHDLAALPLFSEQPQYELEDWTREFLRRHDVEAERVRIEVRVGAPGQHVLELAASSGADMDRARLDAAPRSGSCGGGRGGAAAKSGARPAGAGREVVAGAA